MTEDGDVASKEMKIRFHNPRAYSCKALFCSVYVELAAWSLFSCGNQVVKFRAVAKQLPSYRFSSIPIFQSHLHDG